MICFDAVAKFSLLEITQPHGPLKQSTIRNHILRQIISNNFI